MQFIKMGNNYTKQCYYAFSIGTGMVFTCFDNYLFGITIVILALQEKFTSFYNIIVLFCCDISYPDELQYRTIF